VTEPPNEADPKGVEGRKPSPYTAKTADPKGVEVDAWRGRGGDYRGGEREKKERKSR